MATHRGLICALAALIRGNVMNWQKPSTPIKLMFGWHCFAVVFGLILAVAVGADAAVPWFAAGVIGIPVITAAAIAWSLSIRKRSNPGSQLAAPVRAPVSAPNRASVSTALRSASAPSRSERRPEPEPVYPASGRRFSLLGSDGYPWMEVEGEFARMPAIHMAIGRAPGVDEEIELTELAAELRPEPTNPYDRNAVMVIINGWHVGYLPREEAARYHAPIARLAAADVVPVATARLWATTRRDYSGGGTKSHARITLALGTPERLAPLNNPPAAPYSLIPWGSGLQVTGEEHHLAELSDFITPEGDGIAIGTVHRLELRAPKGATKEVVEVRLDGERIGQMTPASSTHFLPTIKHLEDQGRVAAVWVRVKGSTVAAQAVLQATKAHELPHDWFGSAVTLPVIYPARVQPAPDRSLADDVAEITGNEKVDRPAPMWND